MTEATHPFFAPFSSVNRLFPFLLWFFPRRIRSLENVRKSQRKAKISKDELTIG